MVYCEKFLLSRIDYLTLLKKQRKLMSKNMTFELTSIQTDNNLFKLNSIVILFVTTETALDISDSVYYIEYGFTSVLQ